MDNYSSKPAKDKRKRNKIAELRHRQYRDKIWHYGKRYFNFWLRKVKGFFNERRPK